MEKQEETQRLCRFQNNMITRNSDPYLFPDIALKRLFREYDAHPRLIVAVDFDDTVFDYHGVGSTHDKILETVKLCKKANFYVVVFTASAPERFPFIKEFLENKGIVVDSINENPIPLPYGNHKKIFYNILLDDRAGLGESYKVLNSLLEYVLCEGK